ncbi:lytic polysaccharide monooxygenase [Macrolepiota fuliginosa MF-IS2]|uniref:lytic cellulose monooxygenase (C4-dehydrogenating) n=1 Tax=Macrolepiota fuliginosa MF-IS2 TaxID=1400762 RepID=A0A9P6BY79_9AGAR|nr:lytic polysaccharide monooxygenase [Macrolepiota fuliginosa MF-IS2]
MLKSLLFGVLLALAPLIASHYTFPALVVNGVQGGDWVNVRMTNNHFDQSPVTDVSSIDFRCYTSATNATATTIDVAAGSQLGIAADDYIYHPGVVNVYMAKAPGDVSTWDGSGTVWFKVYQITAVTDGGTSISWPSTSLNTVTFTVPKNLPSGQYLVRVEAIALHVASTFGGAQFYLSCGQINVTGGGSGTPGPLVAIPGVYTGNEPGILINIYYPIPATYIQPGPAVWSG